jgi:hypothetical protein
MRAYAVAAIALSIGTACGKGAADAPMDAASREPPKVADATFDSAFDAALPIPASCAGMLQPPTSLACTGLYSDVAAGTLARAVRSYAPAVPLWADGSTKERWIYLPTGGTIDAADSSEWIFPVGTRVWKQFSRAGHRVETRFFEKTLANYWAYGTYQWSADETSATLAPGGDITLPNGETYQIPTIDECQDCHEGRSDRLLGFEQVSLGLPGATGLTLDELAKEGLLSPIPSSTHLDVGDDGTHHAAAPLTWLHINCGVTCHNTNAGSLAYALGMNLRLDASQLDGRSASAFPSIATTESQAAESPSFPGATRIVPGYPHSSLLYQLIDERESTGASIQMPPIASRLIDTADVEVVGAWIAAMPPAAHPMDAGTDARADSGRDAAADAGRDAVADADAEAGDRRDASPDGVEGSDGGMKDAQPTDASVNGDARDAAGQEAGDAS